MLRKLLLPALAAATLAGCATGYTYRGGHGDYYYGQPRVDYRYHDPYGIGGFGYGFGGYYYDGFGRLHYGNPYGFYGYPYGGYGSWWYRPRPHHGHGDRDHDHDHDGDRDGRRPPWRDFGRTEPRQPATGDDARPRRQSRPFTVPAPHREQRMTRPAPRVRSDSGGGSPMGRVIRRAKAAPSAADE